MARENLPGAETTAFTLRRVYVLDHSIKLAPALICVLSGFRLSPGHSTPFLIVGAITGSDNGGEAFALLTRPSVRCGCVRNMLTLAACWF